jgi:Lamin Tail Domain
VNAIEGSGFRRLVRNPSSFLALLLLATLLIVTGCGGGGEQAQKAQPPPPAPADKAGGAPAANAPGGSTVESPTSAETLEDSPFELNQRQPVPPDFRAAYQRKALIVVEFIKEKPDSTRGIEYPQGIKPDSQVDKALKDLRADYPQVEFFTYDINSPGSAESSEDLGRGEYGTLAAQLEVGYTPFVAMLAPRGDTYIIENLFQGYVDRGVLDQALFDLTRSDVGGNSSDIDVILDRVELTERGGGIEYITVINQGDQEADLSGFTLKAQDPDTGEIDDSGDGLQITGGVTLEPGETASIGRESGIVDADGNEVVGTFSNGDSLTVGAGDQVALLDNGGAVVDTISI